MEVFFINKLLKQIINHPISSFFLITAYVISSLLISVGTSSAVAVKQYGLEKLNGLSSNALSVSLTIGKEVGFSKVEEILCENLNDTYIRMDPIYVSSKGEDVGIISEYFLENPQQSYPLLKGKYISKKNIEQKDKIALVGSSISKQIYLKDNKEYIDILNETYEVVGILGKTTSKFWDDKIVVPMQSVPNGIKAILNGQDEISFYVDNNNHSVLDKCKNLVKFVNGENGNVETTELSEESNVIADNFTGSDVSSIALLVYLIAILNIISISIYWYSDIRRDIGIRKAFGGTNFVVAKLILLRLFCLSILGFLISLAIQLILSKIITDSYSFSLNITFSNIVVGMIISLMTGILSSIIPIYKAIKTEPIEIVKG